MKNVILIGAHGQTSRVIIPRLLAQMDVSLTLEITQPGTGGDRPQAYER
jgi:hypothetical protein